MTAAVIVTALVLLGAAGLLLAAGLRGHVGRGTPSVSSEWMPPDDEGPPEEWGDGPGGVREPRRPLPSGGSATAAADPGERAA